MCHAANSQREASTQQQTLDADVQRLLEAYKRPSVPSPEPIDISTTSDWWDAAQAQLRSVFIQRALPVYAAVKTAEERLEADIPSVGNAIIVMVAIIMYDMGWNNILDRLLGDSVQGSVSCILVGLGMVLGVKILGLQPKDYWRI